MSFWHSSQGFKEIPGLSGFTQPLQDEGNLGYGRDVKQSKQLLKQMGEGNYDNLLGTYLSPLKDQFNTNMRENERAMSMGGNAFMQGAQPGLMAALGNESRLKSQEQLGMQLSAAVPQLYGQAASTYRAGRNATDAHRLAALQAAAQTKIGGNQFYQTPSTFSSTVMPLIGAAGGMMTGLGGLGARPFGPH